MHITKGDRDILRALAAKQAQMAAGDDVRALYSEWKDFGRNAPGARPMIRVELGTFAGDVIPPLMRCEGEEARAIEWALHSNTANREFFGDDTLVRDHISVPVAAWFEPFGLPVKREVASEAGGMALGHRFVPYLRDFGEDYRLLGTSRFGIDREKTSRRAEELNELFGDLLPVRVENDAVVISPMQNFVHVMSMEDLYVAMCDEPEKFEEALSRLVDDYLNWFDLMEREGVLTPTTADQHLCQGSYCFTDELPQTGKVGLKDIWMYMDSQETSGTSPRMYKTLVLPHYKRLAEKFGLVSYGCCEAVHALWRGGLDGIPNIRKVSISPWCDEEMMGEALRGSSIVYLRKPTPNLLGVDEHLDEDAVRVHFRKTARAASGCRLEIAQRDVYRIHNNTEKVKRYVALIREEIGNHYHR